MCTWQPTQVEVVSMAQELGSMPPPEGALAGGEGWTVRNSFGRTIDPWSPTGFAGVLDDWSGPPPPCTL